MADTTISYGLTIDGNIESEGSLAISGTVIGRVDGKSTVETGAQSSVSSDVTGTRIAIAGTVLGNVEATERVDLLSGARLTGNVRAPRLTIADGATFRGKVDMEV